MRKRITALALLLCLTLTACGGETDSQGQTSFLGKAAGLEETAVLLTVDGREVPAWRYLYWLAYTCDRIREQYEESGMKTDWGTPLDGGTLADYARDQALADTVLYATVENWAEQYGCQLTEEDRTALAEQWEENAAGHGGEDAYLQELADLGLDRERAEELAGVGRMYAKLYALYETAGSALAPTGEDLKAYGDAQSYLTVDRILISAGEDREAARQRASELFSRLNTASDQGTEFSTLAADSDDKTGPRTLKPGEGTLDPALEEAAAALAERQCSGILESDEGFSILRRLPTDTDSLKDTYFDSLLQNAAENAAVETADTYKKLETGSFYEKLRDMRETSRNP